MDLRNVAKRDRVAIWRELRRIRALNLRPNLWALGLPGDGEPRLEAIHHLLGRCDAAAAVVDAQAEHADGDHLDRALSAACRHLWDAFFNDLDRLVYDVSIASEPEAAHVATYEHLRTTAAEIRLRDLLGREAQRALRRLEDCGRLLREGDARPATPDGRPRLAVADHTVTLRDGDVRSHFVVEPPLSADWERQFADFEARTYLPAADRIPLVCQSFVVCAPRGSLAEHRRRLERRLELFAGTTSAPARQR